MNTKSAFSFNLFLSLVLERNISFLLEVYFPFPLWLGTALVLRINLEGVDRAVENQRI